MHRAKRFVILSLLLSAAMPAALEGAQQPPPASRAPAASGPVARSRRAIVSTGMTDAYFDAHFKLVRLVERPADTRVVWKYAVKGYEATLTDTVGYYTENQRRVPVHSIKESLGATREVANTITRQQARAALKACLGTYRGETVVFVKLAGTKGASLYLTGHTASARGASEAEREREREREKEHARQQKQRSESQKKTGGPPPPSPRPSEGEDEERERMPIYVGYVDVETGKCVKVASAAAP